jgi:glutathione S-transferase
MTDSNIICEYLEEAFPDFPLSPRDPKLRSRMRKWMLHSEEDLHSAIATASFNKRHRARMLKKHSIEQLRERLERAPSTELAVTTINRMATGMPAEQENAAYEKIKTVLDWMEHALSPGPWLLGASYSLADIAMAPYINRIEVLDRPELIGSSERPAVADWWMRTRTLPSFQSAMAFKNPDKSDPLDR